MLGLNIDNLHSSFGDLEGAEEGCEIKEDEEELHVPGWDGLGEASDEQRQIKIDVIHRFKEEIESYPSARKRL